MICVGMPTKEVRRRSKSRSVRMRRAERVEREEPNGSIRRRPCACRCGYGAVCVLRVVRRGCVPCVVSDSTDLRWQSYVHRKRVVGLRAQYGEHAEPMQ